MKLKNSRIQTLIIYSILSAIALVMLFPLLWLISTALKSPTENIWQSPPQLLPSQPTLENFSKVWQFLPFGTYLYNSILVSVLTVGLNLLFCSLAAYPLARLSFVGRNGIFIAIVSTIMIPGEVLERWERGWERLLIGSGKVLEMFWRGLGEIQAL